MTNKIQTRLFGEIEYTEDEVVFFPSGIIGLENLKRYLMLAPDNYQPLKFLVSLDNPVISFTLINPYLIDPDYDVSLTDSDRSEIELVAQGRILVYAILTLAEQPEQNTVNLMAPVILNPDQMRARQIAMSASSYSIAHPIPLTGESGDS